MVDYPLNRGTNMASDLVPVVPSNSDNLPTAGRAIRCRPDGVSGALKFVANSGEMRETYINAGETLLVAVLKVFATGTAATKLEVYI
jgi:hypothetical protein